MSDKLRSLDSKNHHVPSLSLAAILAVNIVDMIKQIDSTHRDYQDLITLLKTVVRVVCSAGDRCRQLQFKNSKEVPSELTDMITRLRTILDEIESECEYRIYAIDMEVGNWKQMGFSARKGPEINDMIKKVSESSREIEEFKTSILTQKLHPHDLQKRGDFEEKYSPKISDSTSGSEIKLDGLWHKVDFDSDVLVVD